MAQSTTTQCICGAPDSICIGEQKGSKFLKREVLERYFLNRHVKELMGSGE